MCNLLDAALLVALSAAFLLGLEHSIEPDHVVAVSTIVTQSRSPVRSLLAGSLWGLGHTLTLLIAGLVVILLRVQLPTTISIVFEFGVGLMLVALGIWTVVNVRRRKLHFHVHSHDGKLHAHLHSHSDGPAHDHLHIPFSVGIVHGLAGSGALIVLVMSTMANATSGLLFIAAFGAGLVIAMSVIGSALNAPISLGGGFAERTGFVLQVGTGLLSTVLGASVVIGFVF